MATETMVVSIATRKVPKKSESNIMVSLKLAGYTAPVSVVRIILPEA